jgi:hypothetical protein
MECAFFQSESYTLNEKKCEQEIAQQKNELIKQNKTVEAICVDVKINLEKNNAFTILNSWRSVDFRLAQTAGVFPE